MFNIMLVLALNFAITPFLAYPNAWLVREMRFGSIAAVRFVGALVHAASAITMAWLGLWPGQPGLGKCLDDRGEHRCHMGLRPPKFALEADCARYWRCGFVRGETHCYLADEHAGRRGAGTVAGKNPEHGGCRLVQSRARAW